MLGFVRRSLADVTIFQLKGLPKSPCRVGKIHFLPGINSFICVCYLFINQKSSADDSIVLDILKYRAPCPRQECTSVSPSHVLMQGNRTPHAGISRVEGSSENGWRECLGISDEGRKIYSPSDTEAREETTKEQGSLAPCTVCSLEWLTLVSTITHQSMWLCCHGNKPVQALSVAEV